MTNRHLRGRAWRLVGAIVGVSTLAAACSDDGSTPATGSVATVVGEGATYPTVAVSPSSGRGFVVWVGLDGEVYNVYLAAAERGSTNFSAPVRVNDIAGDVAPHEQAPAQVAVGPNGEIYVLWQNNTVIEGRRFPASDLRLAVSTDGGRSFLPAITVNDDAGEVPSSHTFHNMAVAADGTVYVSWIDSREQDRRQADPHAGHRDGSHAMAGPDIRIAASTDSGASFSASYVVDRNSCPCCRTGLAVGPDGSVYVAWRKIYPGDIRDIAVARARPGSLEFDAPVRVAADDWVYPGCPHAGPSIRTDAGGRLHVGWYTGQEERQGLWYAVSSDGGSTFGGVTPLLVDEWVPPSQVALTAAGDEMLVAWENRTLEPAGVYLGGIGLGGPSGSAAHLGAGRSPALDGNGDVSLSVWLDRDAIRAVWASTGG